MTIAEMHVWFRQYAQQMGMQNVRAILPEQIDLLINTSITDTVNQLIKENIGITNDRVITDNSKIGQINALRTLYKVITFDLTKANPFLNLDTKNARIGKISSIVGNPALVPNYTFLVDFSINYCKATQGYKEPTTVYKLVKDLASVKTFATKPTTFSIQQRDLNSSGWTGNKLNFVYDSINNYYKESEHDNVIGYSSKRNCYFLIEDSFIEGGDIKYGMLASLDNGEEVELEFNEYTWEIFTTTIDTSTNKRVTVGEVTNFFPVRLIDDAYLADTLNDFVLKNRLRSPILTIYNGNIFDLYIDKFTKSNKGYTLENDLVPYQLRMSYIAKPAIVKYSTDIGGNDIDCDLPESMHIDILKHAVDLYHVAVTGSLHAQQQAQQNQQQEQVRNNYRNEGYQQPQTVSQ